MRYLTLNNGIKIPIVGLGIYKLNDDDIIVKAIDDIGYRLIDTARMYGNEKILGRAIKRCKTPREELFITSKVYTPDRGYEKTKRAIDDSLKNLGLDYIDLMLIHEPYSEGIEMYKALGEAFEEGKVKSIGISNYNKKQYLDLLEHCNIVPAVNQVEAHVFYSRKELQKVLEEHGTIMEAWSPLATGKNNIFTNKVLVEIGEKYNKTSAQIALKYLLYRNMVIIPKSANLERLKENIDLFDFELTKEDIEKIETLENKISLFGWYD